MSGCLTVIVLQELDIQYTVGMATSVPVTYYFIGYDAQDDLGGFLDEANLLLGLENPPLVLTTSYGRRESSTSFALTEYVFSRHTVWTLLTFWKKTVQRLRSTRSARYNDLVRLRRQRPGLLLCQRHTVPAHLPLQLPLVSYRPFFERIHLTECGAQRHLRWWNPGLRS